MGRDPGVRRDDVVRDDLREGLIPDPGPAGSYRLWTDDHLATGSRYAPSGWNRGTSATPRRSAASTISVATGRTVSRSWTLPRPVFVAGGTTEANRLPLAGIWVGVFADGVLYQSESTNDAGGWSMPVLPGTYRIAFSDDFNLYSSGWWSATAPSGVVAQYSDASDVVPDERYFMASARLALRTPPSAPRAVTAEPSNGGIGVSWTAPATDGGGPILRYMAEAAPGGAHCLVPATARTCTVTGLSNGTAYTITVRAIGTSGAGPASAPTVPVTPGP